MPDSILGSDIARGKPSTITIDGQDRGDARLTDGDDASAFETEWGSQAKELVATIDLSSPRALRAVKYLAGDANWIFRADVSTSLDGVTFTPVTSAQKVDLHGKWGGPHDFSLPGTLSARYLRIRFYSPDKIADCVRLPVTIQAFDGIDEETITVPTVGTTIASGTLAAKVPAHGAADLALLNRTPMKPGSYLLGMTYENRGKPVVRWSRLLVRPADTVDQNRTRRFGINGSQVELVPELQRCGFGSMRFENSKWQMFSPARGTVAFDGSVAPWNVPLDTIFGSYRDHGMQVLPYVFQTPEWATKAAPNITRNRAGYPPQDPADYGEAIYQLVARYGTKKVEPQTLISKDHVTGLGLIQAVELWNEPNLVGPDWAPFVGPLDEYFSVLRAGVEGARRADPHLPVSAAGWAGIDLDIVGTLAEHHYTDGKTPLDLIDIINVHFYSGRQEPETCGWDPNVERSGPASNGTTYPEQLENLVAWRDRLKPSAEIWLSETGNDVGGPIGRSERHQAAKVPRAVLMALAAGIERVFIYREKGSDPAQHAGAGLLRNDGSVRAQWFTVATMIRQLQGFTGRAGRLPTADPASWVLLWQDCERRLITAWTTGASAPLGLEVGPATVTNAFGGIASVATTATVPIGYFPTYLSVHRSPQLDHLAEVARARDAKRTAQRQRLA